MVNKIDERGFALVTVMLLGSMSMVLLALGAYLVSTGTLASGVQRRYQGQLEVTAGVGELIMGQLVVNSLTCQDNVTPCVAHDPTDPAIVNPNDPTECLPASLIFFADNIYDALDKTNNHEKLVACYLSSNVDPNDADRQIVSIKIIANSDSAESAVIDVVYRIEKI